MYTILQRLTHLVSQHQTRRTTTSLFRHLTTTTATTTTIIHPPTTMSDNPHQNPKEIPITLPPNLTKSQLLNHTAYKTWSTTLLKSLSLQHSNPSHPFHKDPYHLTSIKVQSIDYFGDEIGSSARLGFLKFQAEIRNGAGEVLPGSVFMRGGSVAMLLVLTPTTTNSGGISSSGGGEAEKEEAGGEEEEEEYVVLTIQPRIAAGSLGFIELPAGMIDDSGSFSGAAAREIKEETGIVVEQDELVDLTKLALGVQDQQRRVREGEDGTWDESHLQKGIYPSPGGCDEFIPVFLVRKRMERKEIEGLKGRLTGLRERGEKITLMICRLRDLWWVAARDGKTLAALALYEGLKRDGRV